ncbi:MAG: hypothetical protein Q9187_009633, partial [Circinaria calcarea]
AYLLEPQWNPMMEEQALCRVHRMGQTKAVTTIRYIMSNSFEEVTAAHGSFRYKVVLIQDRKKDLANLTFSNARLSEADVGAGRLQVRNQTPFPKVVVNAVTSTSGRHWDSSFFASQMDEFLHLTGTSLPK